MAFLDNSGDIILDAVLTDTGRMRLAKGDGTFKIVKFALGDDEIDYSLFNKSHASGSAYYDLEIMQTPVLEAFTNNTSLLKHKLISMPQTNLLYLPVVKLNDVSDGNQAAVFSSNDLASGDIASTATNSGAGLYFLPADDETRKYLNDYGITGVLDSSKVSIKAVQGLNTTDISYTRPISTELRETQYIVSMDNRFSKLVKHNDKNVAAKLSYIDDDEVASYYLSTQDDEYVTSLDVPTDTPDVISGPQGSEIAFNLYRSEEIETSTSLFLELGGGASSVMEITNLADGTIEDKFYYIDTNVRITGATTGSSIDVPVRVMKYYITE